MYDYHDKNNSFKPVIEESAFFPPIYCKEDEEGKTCTATFMLQEIPLLRRLVTFRGHMAIVCRVVRRTKCLKADL